MGANPSAESIGSHRALLAIGANLGDRDATMRSALASLESDGVLRLIRRSAWYETAPVGGPPGQPPFLNGAAVVETKHDALSLMALLLQCEKSHGRQRSVKDGPRTLDLDLLLFENEIIDHPSLNIPHPRMESRRFVLVPAAEIASNWVHPVIGKTLGDLLTTLDGMNPWGPSPGLELSGKTAMVTGASSGIGLAIAEELAQAGARVIIHGRNEELLAKVCHQLGKNHRFIVEDLSITGSGSRLAANALKMAPSIDIWIHNAGADILTGEMKNADFYRKLALLTQVDVVSCIEATRAIGESFKHRGNGAIVTIGWDQADTGMEGDSGQLFGAVKGGVMAFSKALAMSLAPYVRVNCVAPGWIKTAWGDHASTAWQERVLRETPLGRWGTPADIARCTRFLCGPNASFITGQIIQVNGGAVR